MLNFATSELISSPLVNLSPGRRWKRQRSAARLSHLSHRRGSSFITFSRASYRYCAGLSKTCA